MAVDKPLAPPGKPVWTSDNYPLQVSMVRLAFCRQPALELPRPALGFCMCPGRAKAKSKHIWARDLAADLQSLQNDHKCDALVTLLPPHELKAMGLEALGEKVAEAGLAWYNFPITDKRAPSQGTAAFLELVEGLAARLRRQERVVVHCNGGKGRSALVAAAVLYVFKASSGTPADALSMRASMAQVWRHEGALHNPLQQAFFYYVFMFWKPKSPEAIRQQEEAQPD